MVVKSIRHRVPSQSRLLDSKSVDAGDLFSNKLQQILACRGVESLDELDYGLSGLIPPSQLLNADRAAEIIFRSITNQERILIIGDFDADGATSSAIMVKSLTMMGATEVDFLVPDRFKFGYGLSVKLVEEAAKSQPQLIITVDNGIANHQGVERANQLNIPVIITDHHLAAETLPDAKVIVNPNQPDDKFPSKNLAGVGVAFYLMLQLRSLMRANNWFIENQIEEPNLAELLDIVALGTVADVVVLDKNNRILVEQGLKRIRSGKACFGINALLQVAKRQPTKCQASDLGFALGPRLNAAGRLDDMSIGIECLLAENEMEAFRIANKLDKLNLQRRNIEQQMLDQANQDLQAYFEQLSPERNVAGDLDSTVENQRPITLCLYDPKWHQGVIGILASRVKEKINRPVIVFAKDDSGTEPMIKGSARSVPGVHIRDVLALVDSSNPGLIDKFGGHAMAAGLSLKERDFQLFSEKLLACTESLLGGQAILDEILTDANLDEDYFSLEFATELRNAGPWGQGFPEPLFDDVFEVVSHRVVAEKHLKLILQKKSSQLDAIHFFFSEDLDVAEGDLVRAVYKLDINEFRGNQSLQLIVDQLEKLS
ncbi:MAG: single-stranded-DNA-specific exonuclease RecJ [Kangiellaceae bacterium]